MVDTKDKGNFTFFSVKAPEKQVKGINLRNFATFLINNRVNENKPRNFTMFSINNGATDRTKNSINNSFIKRTNPPSYNSRRYSSYTYFKTRDYEQYNKSNLESKSNDLRLSEETKLNLRKVIRRFNFSKLYDQITLFGKYTVRGLIDTGADVSLLDTTYAKRLGIKVDRNRRIIIKDLNKSRIPAMHCIISINSIRNYSLGTEFDFYLYDDLDSVIGAPLLIGMNVINAISKKYRGFLIPPIEYSSNNMVNDRPLNLVLNAPNFREEVIKGINQLLDDLKFMPATRATIEAKSFEILDAHIARAKRGEITIPSDVNPLTNAATIIYATLESNSNLPKVSGTKLSKMVGASSSMAGIMYNKYYKVLAPKEKFSFKGAQIGESRKPISYFIFDLLINNNTTNVNIIVSQLKEIILNTYKQKLSTREKDLIQKLSERDIQVYQDMIKDYPDIFNKYFSDLVNIIKLLIISIKSHKIIGADFSAADFGRYLLENKINLLTHNKTGETLFGAIREIFYYLKSSKYSIFFPDLTKTDKPGTSRETRIDIKRKDIVGSRIKLYVMKNIYKGRYLDKKDGLAKCPDCVKEGFKVNTSTPRKRSKDFHHSNGSSEEDYNRYDSNELFSMFTKNRGNPYFLNEIIKEIESQSVVLKCTCHHKLIHYPYFTYFKKLISWENIPREFPFHDIFDLPADIIHALVLLCVDNSFKTKRKNKTEKASIKLRLINALKKKHIIDRLYGGICPACGEFNTKDHLTVFDYNHLYEVSELTIGERELRKKRIIPRLYNTLSCLEIINEMEKKHHRGAYLCSNCHFVIHRETENVNEIYDDNIIIRTILDEQKITERKFNRNLVQNNGLIKEPLKPEKQQYEVILNYLFALFEISKKKKGGISRKDLTSHLGIKECKNILEGRKFLEKYVKIVPATKMSIPLYYLKSEGEMLVRLMYYFRDYYKNLKK